MLVYGECECFVMQMLYVCVLCASCGSSQCCVLHDLQFVNAGRGCNRRPYRRGILQSRSHNCFIGSHECLVVVVYPLPWPLLVGGVRCSRLWSTSQLLRPSGQQCSHSGGVCPQIQGRQCGAYVGAVEEMMCVVCVDVTEGA